jgi:hypothetical protein
VWPYRHAGAGRREFGRVVLASLTASARAELDTQRALGRRLRARRAERRLAELEEALERLESGAPPQTHAWYTRPGAAAVTGTAFLVSVVVLAAVVGMRGPDGVVVGVLDVTMLLATALWFSAAVGAHTRARRGAPSPPNGGSSFEESSR